MATFSSSYQQPTTYSMTPTASSSVLRLARPLVTTVPLPRTGTIRAPSITYQPKSGLVQGQIPSGGLVRIPVPGVEPGTEPPMEEVPAEEGLSDKILSWWSRMPLSQKAMTAGAVVAAGVGGWWLIWGRKKKSA